MNVCSLNVLELKTIKGNVKLGSNIPIDTCLEKDNNNEKIKLESTSLDDYFTSLIENKDYDSLHKYYDIETIEKNSNIRSIK